MLWFNVENIGAVARSVPRWSEGKIGFDGVNRGCVEGPEELLC